ncbi:thiamine diphosphokinase [Spirochaeta dissipatitropha]
MLSLIITGGEKPEFERVSELIAESGWIAAADSGYDWAISHNISVDLLIGDLDSIQNRNTDRAKNIVQFPEDKDFSDTELALMEAEKQSPEKIGIIGGGGGRFDHLLAISSLFWSKNPPDFWISSNAAMYHVYKELKLKLEINSCISVFSTSNIFLEAYSSGLKWPLQDADWQKQPVGISNRSVSELIHIQVERGSALIIVPFDEQE